jgi:hypothetical protein
VLFDILPEPIDLDPDLEKPRDLLDRSGNPPRGNTVNRA